MIIILIVNKLCATTGHCGLFVTHKYIYPYPCTDLMLAAVLNMFYKKAKDGMQGD